METTASEVSEDIKKISRSRAANKADKVRTFPSLPLQGHTAIKYLGKGHGQVQKFYDGKRLVSSRKSKQACEAEAKWQSMTTRPLVPASWGQRCG